jgi:hypothetical protein
MQFACRRIVVVLVAHFKVDQALDLEEFFVYKAVAFIAFVRYTGTYQSFMTASCTLVKGPVLTYWAL